MWWDGGMGYALGWGDWVLMSVAMLVLWGLAIAVILALFRTRTTADSGTPRDKTHKRRARDVLDQRFARRNISSNQCRTRTGKLRTRD